MIAKHAARMAELYTVLERDGCIHGVSKRDPGYSILLTKNGSSEAPWRVTSFRDGQPVGHREYDRLEGGGPTQNAFQEFAGDGIEIVPRMTAAAQFRDALKAFVEWQSDCLNYGKKPTARSHPTDDDLCELDRARKLLKPAP